MGRNIRGFTLIEMMMVSAIVGLLASIAIPKFGNMIIKAKEASVKAKLGSLRSAITIYYADTEGIYAQGLTPLTLGGKYLDVVPTISIPTQPQHVPSNMMNNVPDWGANAAWYYHSTTGRINVTCSHADSIGMVWSTY